METLIQKEAPQFSAEAVLPTGEFTTLKLADFRDKKYVVLFFYPLDFTFVCPSEILAFSNRIAEFEKRDTQVIGVSIDSKFSHFAWRETAVDKGGIGAIKYPLVSDLNKQISRDYGVLLNDSVALRGTFLIDKKGVVRHATLNDLPLGRNIDETLRLVDALQYSEQHGEVCPAGWQKGQEAMKPNAEGVAKYLKEHASAL